MTSIVIPEEFRAHDGRIEVAKLKRSVDIVEVARRLTPLRGSGTHLKGLCPFHEERTAPNHPLFGMDPYAFVGLGIGVHGGISYASECQRWEPEHRSICHVTPSETRMMRDQAEARAMREQLVHADAEALRHDDAWWLGFECNQPDDVSPSSIGKQAHDEQLQGVNERTYKTEAFVYEECVRLAVQLKAIEEGRDARAADPGPSVSHYDSRRMVR